MIRRRSFIFGSLVISLAKLVGVGYNVTPPLKGWSTDWKRVQVGCIAREICGVQPMTGPTGLVFTLRARYGYDIW